MVLSDLLDVDLSRMKESDWQEVERGVAIALAPIVAATPSPLDDLALSWLAQTWTKKIASELTPHVSLGSAPHPEFGAINRNILSADEIQTLASNAGIVIPPVLIGLLMTMFSSVVEALIAKWGKTVIPSAK